MHSIQVLDDTNIQRISQAGDDALVCAAARVSTDSDIRAAAAMFDERRESQIEKNAGLINYLVGNKHGSPFEHGFLCLRVHTPIMAVREWFRHRIGHSYNEQSGRYTEFEPVFWSPGPDRPLVQEGSSAHPKIVPGSEEQYALLQEIHYEERERQWANYQRLLEAGIAKEVARAHIGVFIYTTFYVSVNPRSLMNFLELRTAENAQYEIRMAAKNIEKIFAEHWPYTYAAWERNGRIAP